MDKVIRIPITKKDASQMLAFGFANVAVTEDGTLVTDLHKDQIPAEVLEKAAYKFVLKYRTGGLEHEEMGVARLVESFFMTAEKLKALGIETTDTFKGAAWWVGFKIDDPDVWKRVEGGELCDFSIGGTGEYEEAK